MAQDELEVGDRIAAAVALKGPCHCDATTGAELLERRVRATAIFEQLRCLACGLGFKRVWVGE